MPVAVVGMHRSGTSMVSALLHHAGLYLGPEDELMPATPENQDGFWENMRFFELNEEILGALGGGWDEPPTRPARDGPVLAAKRVKAEALAAEFDLHQPWAWKDPRTTLLLPFWLDLLPDIRIVGCVRNPLEVALSLHRSYYFSYEHGLSLWLEYNQRLLEAAPPDQLLLTHYEAYFADPQTELRRVLIHCGVEISDVGVKGACAAVRRALHHNRFSSDDLITAQVSADVIEMYARLCDGSGWSENGAVVRLSDRDVVGSAERGTRGKLNRDVLDVPVSGGEVDWPRQPGQRQESPLADFDGARVVEELRAQVDELQAAFAERVKSVGSPDVALALRDGRVDDAIEEVRNRLAAVAHELATVSTVPVLAENMEQGSLR
jgi:Sulfotransferase family